MIPSRSWSTTLLILTILLSRVSALLAWDEWPHGRVALRDVSIHFRYAGSGPPVLLIHGNPQHSLTWQWIGPILAEKYTVIAPDNRGMGDSSLPPDGNYSAVPTAHDLKAVLNFLNVSSAYVFSHDKGVGYAAALEVLYPGTVKRMGISEYALPGFGYEQIQCPAPYWDLYANWQLAFFSVPDAAEFFIRGREKDMLNWYFFHGSYSGTSPFSEETLNRYASAISRPGFLRAMFGPFDNKALADDAWFFKSTIKKEPLKCPTIALGGEASFGWGIGPAFIGFSRELTAEQVPKAGHWIADENPKWVANRLLRYFGDDPTPLEPVDLSWFDDKVTLQVGYLGTYRHAEIAESMGNSTQLLLDTWQKDD